MSRVGALAPLEDVFRAEVAALGEVGDGLEEQLDAVPLPVLCRSDERGVARTVGLFEPRAAADQDLEQVRLPAGGSTCGHTAKRS